MDFFHKRTNEDMGKTRPKFHLNLPQSKSPCLRLGKENKENSNGFKAKPAPVSTYIKSKDKEVLLEKRRKGR